MKTKSLISSLLLLSLIAVTLCAPPVFPASDLQLLSSSKVHEPTEYSGVLDIESIEMDGQQFLITAGSDTYVKVIRVKKNGTMKEVTSISEGGKLARIEVDKENNKVFVLSGKIGVWKLKKLESGYEAKLEKHIAPEGYTVREEGFGAFEYLPDREKLAYTADAKEGFFKAAYKALYMLTLPVLPVLPRPTLYYGQLVPADGKNKENEPEWLMGFDYKPTAIEYNQKYGYLAAGDLGFLRPENTKVVVWDLNKQKSLKTFWGYSELPRYGGATVSDIEFGMGGELMAIEWTGIDIIEVKTLKKKNRLNSKPAHSTSTIEFRGNRPELYTGKYNGEVFLFNIDEKNHREVARVEDGIEDMEFVGENLLAVGTDSGEISIFSIPE